MTTNVFGESWRYPRVQTIVCCTRWLFISRSSKQTLTVQMDCRRRRRRSFAIRPSTYRPDCTHACTTHVHRFWKAKAQHASPTPHLSSASKIARAQQHRAIPCALKHQASARLSCLATSRVHLYFYSAAQNADNCCYTHQQALHTGHRQLE